MLQDSPGFRQDTGKLDLTTTTAVRLLLDKASDVEEALELLSQYAMHASAGQKNPKSGIPCWRICCRVVPLLCFKKRASPKCQRRVYYHKWNGNDEFPAIGFY